jgi:transcription elongation factor Elf1
MTATRTVCDCPTCEGTKRVAPTDYHRSFLDKYPTWFGYDAETDTVSCNNCGGRGQYATATGKSYLREDGTPCVHKDASRSIGRCYTEYTCIHCGHSYTIDSSD